MDKSWLFIAIAIWAQASFAVAQNCTYGEPGSLTLICVNATTDYIKNASLQLGELVETVRCDNCSLENIQESYFGVRGNRIITLDFKSSGIKQIQTGAFTGLNFLEKLLLSDNSIAEIQPGILRGLKKIRILVLQNNTITVVKNEVFINATSLKKLNLHKNKIDTIEPRAFTGLKNLADLDLSMNNLTKLEGIFNGLPALQNLNLSYNQIAGLSDKDFKGLASLSRLILSYNQISEIAPEQFSELPLVFLDLSHNKIKTVSAGSFAGLVSLESLDLCHNFLKEVPNKTFQRLNKLHDLNMAFNYLHVLETGVYSSGVPELRTLNLSNNHISTLQMSGAFHMENLHTLDLNFNNISDMNYTTLSVHMPRLSYIDLRENFLPCYLEADMEKFFASDSLDFKLFDQSNAKDKKCINKQRPTPKPTPKPTPPPATAAPDKELKPNMTLQQQLDLIIKDVWKAEQNGTIYHMAIQDGKLMLHDQDEHYNSKPAVITISFILCGLIIALIFLSYSHWLTRRMVRQHAVQRALSQIQLFSSDAELEPSGGHLQL